MNKVCPSIEKVDTKLRAFNLLRGGVHMKKTVRRKFTDEFKEGAVKLVTEQRYKISTTARNLGIHATQLRRWIKGEPPCKLRHGFSCKQNSSS